jgi:YD repeat-containing protein
MADGGLYFTDLRAARVHRLDPQGNITVVHEKTGETNGLAYDINGDLVGIEAVGRRIRRFGKDGKVTEITRGDGVNPMMMPNDLIVDAKGGIYFTDPGPRPVVPGRKVHVYYLPPGATNALIADDRMVRPNGLTITVDGRRLIVIGCSTGGLEALRVILQQLPAGLPPIAVVQHISGYFSRIVAERLDAVSPLDVREAEDEAPLLPGTCLIAPGEHHLAIERYGQGYRARLLRTPPLHHCRPAVDVLFRSAADVAGPHVVAALLTGMGSDGAIGMAAVHRAGGTTIAEHESSCVVYGMPRAAVEMGVVDRVVPLPEIAAAIMRAAVGPPKVP